MFMPPNMITIDGVAKTIGEWSKQYRIPKTIVSHLHLA